MKKNLILFVLISLSFSIQAQKKQNVYYLNSFDRIINNIDSAVTIRIVQEADSGSNLYKLREFYKSERLKKVGMVTRFEPYPVFEGPVISYFENGKRKTIESFKNQQRVGIYYSFYPNGNLKEQREYLDKPLTNKSGEYISYKTVLIGDSLGNKYLDENITGTFKLELDNGDIEEGSYLKGEKNGTWSYFIKKINETYIEEYKSGRFLYGKTIDKNKNIFEYKEKNSNPSFAGGSAAFSIYLNKEIKNSPNISKFNIYEKLVLSFFVNEDNSISNLRTNEAFSKEVADEILMILKRSKWECAKERGKPVKRSVNLPIAILNNQ